jgi:cell wall-associated NlpC family hydrolase
VERLPTGRQFAGSSRGKRTRVRSHRAWARTGMVTGAVMLAGLTLSAGLGSTAQADTSPSLKTLVAKANKLGRQIETLSNQYDGLKIQLNEARTEAKIASEAAIRDAKQLAAGQTAVGQIAAQGYMTGGVDPALQLLQNSNPQAFVNRASIMLQLQRENGDKVSVLSEAEHAALRAQLTARQEQAKATLLAKQMKTKVAAIQAKENVLNGAAYKKAMAIFDQTGNFPDVPIPQGNSVGIQALRWALAERGHAYQWGGSGPDVFDCSGLVMWAYEHVGISLAHLTFDQWNEGVHVARSELQPGDLIFLYGLDHVGMYVGNGLFVDAPHTGTVVQIQPIPWAAFDGAVRIG